MGRYTPSHPCIVSWPNNKASVTKSQVWPINSSHVLTSFIFTVQSKESFDKASKFPAVTLAKVGHLSHINPTLKSLITPRKDYLGGNTRAPAAAI